MRIESDSTVGMLIGLGLMAFTVVYDLAELVVDFLSGWLWRHH